MTEDNTTEMNHMPDDAVDYTRCEVVVEPAYEGETHPFTFVSFPDRDFGDVGDLVDDRLRVSGIFKHFERPEPGEKKELGVVAWGEDGLPRRLECVNGVVITFEDDAPTVHPDGDDH